MFEMTNWKLIEDNQGSNSIVSQEDIVQATVTSPEGNSTSIIKRYDFESKLQRMSTIVKIVEDQSYYSFVKGSPEIIKSLSRPESIPADYDKVLNEYTM
jgi:cation-transporting ATPase 13A2